MFAHRATTALFLVLACATAVFAVPRYNAQPAIVNLAELGEAQADAISDGAGASAAASRIEKLNSRQITNYGLEIGKPLLVKPYPPITSLYAASLQPRTLVARAEPVFLKDSYGRITFNGEDTIAVVAI